MQKGQRPVVARGHKRVTLNATGCDFDITQGNEIFNFHFVALVLMQRLQNS